MLRPPQPAVYIFLLDVSRQALETGYIKSVCNVLLEELDKLPGDGRTQVRSKVDIKIGDRGGRILQWEGGK